MSTELKIAQIIGTIPNLSPAQVEALDKFDTASLLDAEKKADESFGFEADRRLSILSTDISLGVFTAARLAVLGVLASEPTLTEPWTSTVGDFTAEVAPVEDLIQDEAESTNGDKVVDNSDATKSEPEGVVAGQAEDENAKTGDNPDAGNDNQDSTAPQTGTPDASATNDPAAGAI